MLDSCLRLLQVVGPGQNKAHVTGVQLDMKGQCDAYCLEITY